MKRILVVTVGGSCSPIITSIRQHRADHVWFLCSEDDPLSGKAGSYVTVEGPGMVCGPDPRNPTEPDIRTQTGIADDGYTVERTPADDLAAAYTAAAALLGRLRHEYPSAELIADYTGGTKTMSAALVLAALDVPGLNLGLVTGSRADLVKVIDRTESARRVSSRSISLDRQRLVIERLISQFDYAGAVRAIEAVFAGAEIDPGARIQWEHWLLLCRAWDAWDKFDHETARVLLRNLPRQLRAEYSPRIRWLDAVCGSRTALEQAVPGRERYESAIDLVLNARRRAEQRRYDDAVARLYRAVELTAQIRLLHRPALLTGDLDVGKLPEALRSGYESQRGRNGRVQLGLREAYRLLASLEPEDCGRLWGQWEGKVMNALQIRNDSLMAHGFRSVSEPDFERVQEVFGGVISALLAVANTPSGLLDEANQLPRTLATGASAR